jgi:transposase
MSIAKKNHSLKDKNRHTARMSAKEPPTGISQADWQTTPPSVRQLVLTLLATVEQMQQEVSQLREQVNKNSQNSSKPPSSDPPSVKRKPPVAKGERKRGGQPGHEGSGRHLKPPEQVSRFVISRPTRCGSCGALLLGYDPQPSRHQVTELPRIAPEVIEYQVHCLCCLACGQQTRGQWPTEMPAGSFGPRVQATTGYLSGRYGVSQRDIQEMLLTLFGIEIGLGTIPAQEQRLSQALAQPMQEAQAFLHQQPVVNVDETGWRQEGQSGWLWVGSTPEVALFLLQATRSKQGVVAMLGTDYVGIVGSDRHGAYNWLADERRQLCWSHLQRDFQALVDRGGDSAVMGRLLLAQTRRMFALWHRTRDGTLTPPEFQTVMQPIRQEIETLLQLATILVSHRQTQATCRNLLKHKTSLWTFVDHEGVEPTNNAAEQALRRAVLWRKRSFGTQSEAGSRFVERLLTVVISLRRQQRHVLDFLTQVCQAYGSGLPTPSLLPTAKLDGCHHA